MDVPALVDLSYCTVHAGESHENPTMRPADTETLPREDDVATAKDHGGKPEKREEDERETGH